MQCCCSIFNSSKFGIDKVFGFRASVDRHILTRFSVKSYCIATVKNALLKPVNYVTERTIRNFVSFVT